MTYSFTNHQMFQLTVTDEQAAQRKTATLKASDFA